MIRHIKTKKEWKGELIGGVRHPLSIKKMWRKKELRDLGLEVVTPTKEKRPPTDPLASPLNALQFAALVYASGRRNTLLSNVKAIHTPWEKAVARARLAKAEHFDRDDPLVALLRLSSKELDALWLRAFEVE